MYVSGRDQPTPMGHRPAFFFFGVCIWLVMTFNYPVLWVRVRVKVLGSVNSKNKNKKFIVDPNTNSYIIQIHQINQ